MNTPATEPGSAHWGEERTYIRVRAWEGFPAGLDMRVFDDVSDRDIELHVDRVAATWLRENLSDFAVTALKPWLDTLPALDTTVLERIPPEVHLGIGWAYGDSIDRGAAPPRAPRWTVVAVTDSFEASKEIAEALEADCPNICPIVCMCSPRSEFSRMECAAIELELDRRADRILAASGRTEGERTRLQLVDHLVRDGLILERVLTRDGSKPAVSGGTEGGPTSERPALTSRDQTGKSSPPGPQGTFCKSDAVWTVGLDGRSRAVPARVGYGYISSLLRRPNQNVCLRELYFDRYGRQPAWHTSGDAVDDRAAMSTKERLETISEERREAKSRGDTQKCEALDREVAELAEYMRKAGGVHGRRRKLGDEAEAFRKGVGAAIVDAFRVLAATDPALADHLRKSITTPGGGAPKYNAGEPAIAWQL